MGTGAYKVSEITTAVASPRLPIGTKYLENTTAGTIAIQSKSAYGSWEFDVNFSLPTYSYLAIISPIANPASNTIMYYALSKTSSNELRMKSGASVILLTASSYLDLDTWYRLKVARLKSAGTFASIVPSMTTTYPADTFAVFIKGGSFGDDYQLVSTTGGSGTNPVTDSTYTTSEYFVADLDAGDRFTNLKIYNGVKQ